MANNIAGNQAFICNMFGAGFSPCAARGFTGAGAGYPINFWQVNPFARGAPSTTKIRRVSRTYNAMQIEFRKRAAHGAQFNVNYVLPTRWG